MCSEENTSQFSKTRVRRDPAERCRGRGTQILVFDLLLLTTCVTLGNLLQFSEAQFLFGVPSTVFSM